MLNLALFDLDHTLLPLDSDHAWGEFTTRLGWTDAAAFQRQNDAFFEHYRAGTLDVAAYTRFATRALREQGAERAGRARERFLREVIQPALMPAARQLIERHRAAGDTLVVVTATNEWVTRPIADLFGIDELIAIRLARDATGWITGEIEGTPSFAAGKVTRVAEWLAARGLDWSSASVTFYSDSFNDLPLLERVQRPVAANPDARLRALARERGWRIVDLFATDK